MNNFFIVLFVACFITPLVVLAYTLYIDKYRRKKYPEYFELVNRAMEKSHECGDYYDRKISPFSVVAPFMKTLHEDGMLGDEQFSVVSQSIVDSFELCEAEYQELKRNSEQLWNDAHQYAVDNHLRWALLY